MTPTRAWACASAASTSNIRWIRVRSSKSARIASVVKSGVTTSCGAQLIAQRLLLHFAGCGLGQRPEDHAFRRLEPREPLARVLDQLGAARGRSFLERDEGDRNFAPLFVGGGDDGHLD